MNTQGIVGQIARIREQANLLIEKELRNRSIQGIVPAHGAVLVCLFRHSKPIPIKVVVERTGRAKSTVTAMVKTLERHGYILKTMCQSDNRVTYIELTRKGRALRKDFDDISKRLLRRLYGKMSKNNREKLVGQLEIIEQNLNS